MPTSASPGSGSLVADLVINKPLGLSPRHIEFKRAHLYDLNPVGLGAMLLAAAIGVVAYAGALGPLCGSLLAIHCARHCAASPRR